MSFVSLCIPASSSMGIAIPPILCPCSRRCSLWALLTCSPAEEKPLWSQARGLPIHSTRYPLRLLLQRKVPPLSEQPWEMILVLGILELLSLWRKRGWLLFICGNPTHGTISGTVPGYVLSAWLCPYGPQVCQRFWRGCSLTVSFGTGSTAWCRLASL